MQVPLYHTRKWPVNAGSTVSHYKVASQCRFHCVTLQSGLSMQVTLYHTVFGKEELDKDVVKFAKGILCFAPIRRERLVTKASKG